MLFQALDFDFFQQETKLSTEAINYLMILKKGFHVRTKYNHATAYHYWEREILSVKSRWLVKGDVQSGLEGVEMVKIASIS